jgi:hypothetical protein
MAQQTEKFRDLIESAFCMAGVPTNDLTLETRMDVLNTTSSINYIGRQGT